MTILPTMQHPYRVTAPGGKAHLIVMNATDGLPAAFALMGTRAKRRVAVRIAGGCKGMSDTDKMEMLEYFGAGFEDPGSNLKYEGLVWSGGSRMIKPNGEVDPMVTEIPGMLAARNPDCVALGSLPRTQLLTLQDDSRLVLDPWNVPNPAMSAILIVQNSADEPDDTWGIDVPVAFKLMDNWRSYAGFEALGFVAWNGGAVTEQEIVGSAKRGYATAVVAGSGRVSDEFATALTTDPTAGGKVPAGSVRVLDRSDSGSLRSFLRRGGFLGALGQAA